MKAVKKIVSFCFAIAVLFFVTSCNNTPSQTPTSSISPKSPEELIVILHAGGGANGLTYLNAQETFEHYYELGYRYFEYDLKLSADGRIIGTHGGEHLGAKDLNGITYEEFKTLKLENGYTPVNEEWLIDTIRNHPDVSFVIDAKMDTTEGDAAVLKRLEELEDIYNIDISPNIVPEIFSKQMWDIAKETTSFDRYLFSHYKVYYTVDMMLEYFSDERIWGFALPTYTDGDIRSQLYRVKESKKIFVFTPQNALEINDAASMGADGVYLDFGLIAE